MSPQELEEHLGETRDELLRGQLDPDALPEVLPDTSQEDDDYDDFDDDEWDDEDDENDEDDNIEILDPDDNRLET